MEQGRGGDSKIRRRGERGKVVVLWKEEERVRGTQQSRLGCPCILLIFILLPSCIHLFLLMFSLFQSIAHRLALELKLDNLEVQSLSHYLRHSFSCSLPHHLSLSGLTSTLPRFPSHLPCPISPSSLRDACTSMPLRACAPRSLPFFFCQRKPGIYLPALLAAHACAQNTPRNFMLMSCSAARV